MTATRTYSKTNNIMETTKPKIKLLDFDGKAFWQELPADTKEVAGIVLTGDMILVYPLFSDPAWPSRMADHFEAYWKFSAADIDRVNAQTSVDARAGVCCAEVCKHAAQHL